MRALGWICLLLSACGGATEITQAFRVTVHSHKPGLRIYQNGTLLGVSPIVLNKTLVTRELEGGVKRWFVEGRELFPGGGWPMSFETFKEGVRVPVDVTLLFDPEHPDLEVTLSP